MKSLDTYLVMEKCVPCELGSKTSSSGEAAYPRPQLQRSDWICLNGPWKFAFDNEGDAFN